MMKRVLLIGAYANGNLGDMYQGDALAHAIAEVRPDVEIHSVSPSKRRSGYPAARHVRGPDDGAFDTDYINSFDLMMIGGGGLFSAPHAPFADVAWAERIEIPICTMSVGAAGKNPEDSSLLLKKCAAVSVRDEFSKAAIMGVRPDAEIVMDPILLHEVTNPPLNQGGSGILWVPGKIVAGTDLLWSNVNDSLISPADPLISFNPVTDENSGFDDVFDNVQYLQDIEPFLKQAGDSAFVVSERYHGCIFALARGKPTLGLGLRSAAVTSKIDELYRRMGAPEAVVRDPLSHTRQSLRKLALDIDLDAVRSFFLDERAKYLNFVSRCLTF